MKVSYRTLLILALLVTMAGNSIAQEESKKEKKKSDKRIPVELNFESVKRMVHSGLFIFTATDIRPLGSASINLTPYYSEVSVEYYDVYAFLPTLSRRNQVYSFGKTDIEVEGKLDQIEIEEKESRELVRVKFRVIDHGSYRFNFTIFNDGYTYLLLTTPRGFMFTYTGKTEPLELEVEKKEEK